MNPDDPVYELERLAGDDKLAQALIHNPRFLREMGVDEDGVIGESRHYYDTLNDLAVTRAELKGNQRRVTILASAVFFLGTALAAMIAARFWR